MQLNSSNRILHPDCASAGRVTETNKMVTGVMTASVSVRIPRQELTLSLKVEKDNSLTCNIEAKVMSI